MNKRSKSILLVILFAVLVTLVLIPTVARGKTVIISMGGNWTAGTFGKTCRCPVDSNADCICEFVFVQ